VNGYICPRGPSPFTSISLNNGKSLSDYVPILDPVGVDSKAIYASIEQSLPAWIDYAIKVREDLARAA